jgi:hypothetical protein
LDLFLDHHKSIQQPETSMLEEKDRSFDRAVYLDDQITGSDTANIFIQLTMFNDVFASISTGFLNKQGVVYIDERVITIGYFVEVRGKLDMGIANVAIDF